MEFVNAGSIAAGLSPFDPESVAIEAGRSYAAQGRSLVVCIDGRFHFMYWEMTAGVLPVRETFSYGE